ncbi:hypothetical protein Tco_1483161 [Tanacetum coccineum]
MIQAEKPPLTFDELMSTPIDLSTFAMNRLKLNKITRADLVGPVFNLLKGTCKSCVKLEYNMDECYRALTYQLDWTNPEGHKHLVDMGKPLPLQDKKGRLTIPVEFFLNNDLKYLKVGSLERQYSFSITKTPAARRADQNLYKFKEGDFPDLRLNDIEDMLLLIAQNKLFNLEGDVIVDFVTAPTMFTRRIIVQNRVEDVQLDKSKKKRLMRVDEIHKFYDRTLQSVRNILHQRLQNFRLGYNKDMPLRE